MAHDNRVRRHRGRLGLRTLRFLRNDRAAARQSGSDVWKARLMAKSTEDNPRYSIEPGEAEEGELLPGMDMVAYRLTDDHFVKVHIVAPAAPIGGLGLGPQLRYSPSGAAYALFDRAACEQIGSHLSRKSRRIRVCFVSAGS